jgi:hypothetical protein
MRLGLAAADAFVLLDDIDFAVDHRDRDVLLALLRAFFALFMAFRAPNYAGAAAATADMLPFLTVRIFVRFIVDLGRSNEPTCRPQ